MVRVLYTPDDIAWQIIPSRLTAIGCKGLKRNVSLLFMKEQANKINILPKTIFFPNSYRQIWRDVI